jgi:hypothetical protein
MRDVGGTWACVVQLPTTGVFFTKPQTYASNEPNSSTIFNNSRALVIADAIFRRFRMMPPFCISSEIFRFSYCATLWTSKSSNASR